MVVIHVVICAYLQIRLLQEQITVGEEKLTAAEERVKEEVRRADAVRFSSAWSSRWSGSFPLLSCANRQARSEALVPDLTLSFQRRKAERDRSALENKLRLAEDHIDRLEGQLVRTTRR